MQKFHFLIHFQQINKLINILSKIILDYNNKLTNDNNDSNSQHLPI